MSRLARATLPMLLLTALIPLAAVRPAAGAAPATTKVDIAVSVEWDPGLQDVAAAQLPALLQAAGCPAAQGTAATYLEELKAGLADASDYIYAYTRGRFALGTVTVDTEGRGWQTADIRVLADASYRPTADVGGVVAAPTANSGAASGVSVTFYPGAVALGRMWDGRGARCGPWSQPEAWRTIGHEWAHYALFLWDEYYDQFTAREQYCTTTGLPLLGGGERAPASTAGGLNSVMAYHYTADRLWESGVAAGCAATPQQRVNGEPDWQTIQRFYPGVGSPADAPPGPPPAPTFVIAAPAPTEHTSALVKAQGGPAPRGVARGYVVRGPAGAPSRIIGQGELIPGEPALFLGARPSLGDRAHIALVDWSTGLRSVYPTVPTAAPALGTSPGAPAQPLALAAPTWRPAVVAVPRVRQDAADRSTLTGIALTVQDCARRTKLVSAAICPAGGTCGAPVALVDTGGGVFAGTLPLPDDIATRQAASRGAIYLYNPDTGEELVDAYQIGGGAGSGHIGAHPPLLDGAVGVEAPPGQDLPAGVDSRVLVGDALVCQAPPLPAGVRALVGNPVDVQPAVADPNGGRPWGQQPGDPPLRVRLSYSQDLLDRLGVDERSLVLLRFTPQGLWEVVPAQGRSGALDWLAGDTAALAGQGAIYALGAADSTVALPLVVR